MEGSIPARNNFEQDFLEFGSWFVAFRFVSLFGFCSFFLRLELLCWEMFVCNVCLSLCKLPP